MIFVFAIMLILIVWGFLGATIYHILGNYQDSELRFVLSFLAPISIFILIGYYLGTLVVKFFKK
jgi:hypothetical protein